MPTLLNLQLPSDQVEQLFHSAVMWYALLEETAENTPYADEVPAIRGRMSNLEAAAEYLKAALKEVGVEVHW